MELILKITSIPLYSEDQVDEDFHLLPGQTPDEEKLEKKDEAEGERENLQTFVFSATLSKDLQRNLKKSKGKGGRSKKPVSTLGKLSFTFLRIQRAYSSLDGTQTSCC